jgi:hypothetical protein
MESLLEIPPSSPPECVAGEIRSAPDAIHQRTVYLLLKKRVVRTEYTLQQLLIPSHCLSGIA